MTFASLWLWLTGRPRQRPDLVFLLYTRAACPLCDEAHHLLLRYQKARGFTLTTKDVDAADALRQEFGDCVPVVLVNGKVRFRGRINEVLLKRLLDSEPS